MGFWKRLLGRDRSRELKPQRLDYLNEPLALERQGDYDAALTSYRLALRDRPSDLKVLQNMAIAFTKTNRHDDAIRTYRRALEIDGTLAGAHYGLALLLLKRGERDPATRPPRAPRGPAPRRGTAHAPRPLTERGEAGVG